MAAATIVPRHVLGKTATGSSSQLPPSETLGGALIGCGGRGGSTFEGLGHNVRKLAMCDVKFKDKADDKKIYTDFRKVLERKDIDVVAIATHPGWHALISIAAMEAGKDVLCEKPMCRFIAEGLAVAEAERRYGRIFQIGTYGRFGANQKIRKIFESGLLKQCETVLVEHGGVKVKEWSGMVKYKVEPRARQPRLGHVLRPGAAAAVPAPSLRRHPPRLLGLRGRRTGRHGPAPPRRAGLPVRPRRHLAGRNHALRPAAPSRVLHGLGLGAK